MRRTLLGSVIALVLITPQLGAAAPKTHSGTVVSIDAAAGILVIADMGPWRGSPEQSVTNVTVVVDRQTKFVVVRRVESTAPDGWVGGYAEAPASLADIRPGDFVSVELRAETPRRLAAKIIRVATE